MLLNTYRCKKPDEFRFFYYLDYFNSFIDEEKGDMKIIIKNLQKIEVK